MKYLIITIFLFLSIKIFSQNEIIKTNVFIRIYDFQGKKINKGKIKSISETSIELYRKKEIIIIPLNKIGMIKTKHSGGNNVGKGALIGGGSLAITGLLSGDDDKGYVSFSAADKAFLGFIGGSFLGATFGGITTIFKKSKTYIINGDKKNLQYFKEQISNL